jgi:hypothetical protein
VSCQLRCQHAMTEQPRRLLLVSTVDRGAAGGSRRPDRAAGAAGPAAPAAPAAPRWPDRPAIRSGVAARPVATQPVAARPAAARPVVSRPVASRPVVSTAIRDRVTAGGAPARPGLPMLVTVRPDRSGNVTGPTGRWPAAARGAARRTTRRPR